MKSMTGFGQSSIKTKDLKLEISLRTVNGRFQELRFHMPKEYMALERDLKKAVSAEIRRGTIDVYIHRHRSGGTPLKAEAHLEAAKGWYSAYKKLAKEVDVSANLRLSELIRMSDAIQMKEDDSVTAAEKKALMDGVKAAVACCERERKREGAALKKNLTSLLSELSKRVKSVARLRASVVKELEARYKKKLARFNHGTEVDPQRLAQEVVFQLDKSDIDEELTRLNEHISQFKKLLGSTGVAGKKMDFYCQELLREVNTIGSKSQNAELTFHVVESKAMIEKIREQVQNVE
jgi:uncharacterized protein (TIGR00255 family)